MSSLSDIPVSYQNAMSRARMRGDLFRDHRSQTFARVDAAHEFANARVFSDGTIQRGKEAKSSCAAAKPALVGIHDEFGVSPTTISIGARDFRNVKGRPRFQPSDLPLSVIQRRVERPASLLLSATASPISPFFLLLNRIGGSVNVRNRA